MFSNATRPPGHKEIPQDSLPPEPEGRHRVAWGEWWGEVARVVSHLSEGQDGEALQGTPGVVGCLLCSSHGRFMTALLVQQVGEPAVNEGSTTPTVGSYYQFTLNQRKRKPKKRNHSHQPGNPASQRNINLNQGEEIDEPFFKTIRSPVNFCNRP
jgi:hypothetical protein